VATLYAVVALVLAALAWGILGEVDQVVVAPGHLTTNAPQIVVQPLETAVIRSLTVRAGDIVHRGDVLAELDPTFTDADAKIYRSKLAGLHAQARRLEAELGNAAEATFSSDPELDELNRRIFVHRHAYLVDQLATFDAQINELDAQTRNREAEAAAARAQAGIQRKVQGIRKELYDMKTGSLLLLLDAENAAVTVEREAARLTGSALELRAQAKTLTARRTAFLSEWTNKTTEELAGLQNDIDKTTEELRKSDRRGTLMRLTTPADAVVLSVAQRSIGSVAREGEPIFTLVPIDVPLEVTADLDPRDVSLVSAHAAVRVKLDALPFQKHGLLDGVVRVISQDTLDHTENGQTRPVYRAVITISDLKLRNLPAGFRLIAGMGVTAEIKVGRRRLISYVLYPLIQRLDESFREP
jgi:HlyD family secretion protein